MSNNSSSSGIGFTGLLTIVFVTLKLTNYIDWSWWWVLSPLWISVAVFFGVLIIIGSGAFLYYVLMELGKKMGKSIRERKNSNNSR